MKPTVSVIIPAYNSENHIRRSIDSVLSQTVSPLEILVIDDGSIDNTTNIANSYGGIVRVISRGKNYGLPAARNFGIKNASGNWIAFLDSDDQWEIRKNEHALKLIGVLDTYWCMTAQRDVAYNSKPAPIHEHVYNEPFLDYYFSILLRGKSGCPSSMMVKKEIFASLGGFNEKLTTGEDLEMWWRIAMNYPRIGYCPKPLVHYSIDVPGSMTASRRDEQKLIAFWDSVSQIKSPAEYPTNNKLFRKARNQFASKAIRFYYRENYYKAAEHLRNTDTIDFHPMMRLFLSLPNWTANYLFKSMYIIKNHFFHRLLTLWKQMHNQTQSI